MLEDEGWEDVDWYVYFNNIIDVYMVATCKYANFIQMFKK